ncbi:MAG: hypothetical protein HY903_05540 [Deltaproteobacteria bacterium]|nr:hypothetical protein [Deltaproteobacteria bacterium]
MKVAIVSSVGGHLSEVVQLRPIYEKYEHFYILNDAKKLPDFMEGRTYFIKHSERDLWTLYNLWECWQILAKERPDVIVSTGAGPAVPAFMVAGRLGIFRLYIESFCAFYRPTLTGRLIHALRLFEKLFYQWPYLSGFFPKGSYEGIIYEPPRAQASVAGREDLVLVSVGNRREPFPRMLRAAEEALAHTKHRVVWQTGYTDYRPKSGEVHDFLPPEKFQDVLHRASVVICQAGEGSVMEAIHAGHLPIVFPRRAEHGEVLNDHQLDLVTELSKLGWVRGASTVAEVSAAVGDALGGELKIQRAPMPRLVESVKRALAGCSPTKRDGTVL